MTRPKDRLHRVIVVGATPAGIAATNKLGELGIPVTLVDPEPDLDQKLAREEWRLASGVPLNSANRSGLIRILRNPLIKCVLPAELISLKHTPQGFRARLKKTQTFIDPDRCVLCGRCADICPVTTPDGRKPIQFNGWCSLPGRPVIDKREQPPCQAGCPLGVNAQAYIALAEAGRFREALDVVRRDNVLPGICGRVCTHPCEAACRRSDMDEPIAIRDIKRFLADHEITDPDDPTLHKISKRDERIAVIGSGPAGLAAAADLARLGYGVTLFEKEAKPGGLLRYGIGPYRLPRDILDGEIEYIRNLGVSFVTSHPVVLSNKMGEIDDLKAEFDAVIVTTGSWADRRLGVPGEDLEGVVGCLAVLNGLYRDEDEGEDGHVPKKREYGAERLAVIGDGNAAFDLARAVKRLGSDVTILTWFPEDLIPADKEEVNAAREEGVLIMDKTQVIAFLGENGGLDRLRCKPTQPGKPDQDGIPWPVIVPGSEPFEPRFDRAIVAIGQIGSFKAEDSADGNHALTGFKVTDNGFVEVDEEFQTSITTVYAAGDAVSGPSSVVRAMASGRGAAQSVHMTLAGEKAAAASGLRPEGRSFAEIPADIPSLSRPTMPERQAATRKGDFAEVALGLNESQVVLEAERCLQCGICSECLLCIESCSLIGAIDHHEQAEESVEHAGVVIIADPETAPSIKGEDVIRAYGPKAAKSDVDAMITRGFAAAANAMILLGGASERPRGRGVSFLRPDPDLSPDIRIGVFVCRCNDSFGWHDEMDRYLEGLTVAEKAVHAEVLSSACIPEGTARILRAIREKGLTRVVLASCVCCPLDFVCSACTDQRSRLKEALFHGTGVSRAMVETCNLRGEALRYLAFDPVMALKRFSGLIGRSVNRARDLRPLPAPVRTYNFATAVIGESEAAVKSAQTLALGGLEVFMFGNHYILSAGKRPHPNIHHFEGSKVTGISGKLGDFQVFVKKGGGGQVMQVGTVILGEKSRRLIPYIQQKGLPSSIMTSSMQKKGLPGIPFLFPGATNIAGLFMAYSPGLHVSQRKEGAAAAVLAAAIMPRGPRQSKGFIVAIDETRCRGCGRCVRICPYQAVTLHKNQVGGWHAAVDEALCKGCGNCISVCPSNAADSPYRNQEYLEQMLEEVLAG